MKKTTRNILLFVLAFCLTLTLCGCGKVDALIEQIDLIGDVTLQSGDAIQAAEAAYAALNEKQQAKIENYSILQDARTVYDRIRSVANLIDAIGVVTLESENAIIAAENAYNALNKTEQAKIQNYEILPSARVSLVEAMIEQFNLFDGVTLQSGDAIQTAEAAYAALNEDQQAKIENYSILQDARTVYDRIRSVANLIDAIGVVTLESENAIIAAEDAYNALSKAEQAKIDNINTLSAAREALEDARFEAFKDTLVGEWVTDFDNDHPFTLTRNVTDNESLWDGEWSWTALGETFTGKWRLDRDTNTFVVEAWNEEKECKLIEENGFLKLITNDWIWEDPACYVRADEYQAAFDAKFVAIEINSTNYKDYLTEPSLAGYSLDENGNPDKRYPIYLITNKLFEQGYVYMGTSYDFVYEITRQNIRNDEVIYEYSNLIKWHLFSPQRAFFPSEEGTELRMTLGDQISGTIYFIKAEMVAENYCVPEYNYSTYLRTTNGAVYLTGDFIEADCKYEDHLR